MKPSIWGQQADRLLAIAVTFCFFLSNASAVIKYENRGYKGIVVAIHDRIPENEQVIKNLQKLLTNASQLLYNATRGQAYFREIDIIAPKNWTLSNITHATITGGGFFSNADIRIDEANPEHGDNPYTLQARSCGEPGEYIHLTPGFLQNFENVDPEYFGGAERQIVHEWAHLRYGVFDEYSSPNDPEYPMFYLKNNKVYPLSCVRDIPGWTRSEKGGLCTIVDGKVLSDCRFYPDVRNKTIKASLMSYHYIPSVDHFCDDQPGRRHNKEAPNKHNTKCNYRSTWDVISSHEDFSNTKWPETFKNSNFDTKPKFNWKKIAEKPISRYVLVLDVSSSMNMERRIDMLRDASTRFVKDRVPVGSFVGIVTFDTYAKRLSNLIEITKDPKSRDELLQKISSLRTGSRTAIGRGLNEGLNVLKDHSLGTEGGLIILISDGEENEGSLTPDLFSVIEASKVTINTIAFGRAASEVLEKLVKMTGGISYFFDTSRGGTAPPSAVDAAFLESVTTQSDLNVQAVNLVSEKTKLSERVKNQSFIIDQELGKNTVVTVISNDVKNLFLSLIDPKGQVYDSSYSGYNKDEAGKRILVKIENAKPGKWTAMIENRISPNVMNVDIGVTSEAQTVDNQPIRVRSWVSSPEIKLSTKRRTLPRIFAEVKKGYNAVLNATVIASVDPPLGVSYDVSLKDDGKGPDVTKNDGIYSAYFTKFVSNGRYAVYARVINDGKAKLKLGSRASPAMVLPSENLIKELEKEGPAMLSFDITKQFKIASKESLQDKEEFFETEPVAEFERFATAGALNVEDWTEEVSKSIPPNKVVDLRVVTSSMRNDTDLQVVLQWTSPGADMGVGNASRIELRGSANFDDLLPNKFKEAFSFDDLPEPLPSGEVQVINVTIPAELVQDQISNHTAPIVIIEFYFALRAHDKNGNVAEVSNIAAAHLSKQWDDEADEVTLAPNTTVPNTVVPNTTVPNTVVPNTTVPNTVDETKPKGLSGYEIAGIVIAVCVLIIAIGAISYYFLKCRKTIVV